MFLAIPLIAISQPTVIENNQDGKYQNTLDIYEGLVNGDYCRLIELPANKAAVNSLDLIIQAQNDSIQHYSKIEKDFMLQIAHLNIDKQNSAIDIMNLQNKIIPWYKNKWFYLGAGIITGKLLLR